MLGGRRGDAGRQTGRQQSNLPSFPVVLISLAVVRSAGVRLAFSSVTLLQTCDCDGCCEYGKVISGELDDLLVGYH